jgi:hypothetical protein
MLGDDEFYNFLKNWRETDTPPDDYVRFDERTNVLASLELLELVTPLLTERPTLWKWAIIGAHDALQGAMVCALADSTGTSVLEKNSRQKCLSGSTTRMIIVATLRKDG